MEGMHAELFEHRKFALFPGTGGGTHASAKLGTAAARLSKFRLQRSGGGMGVADLEADFGGGDSLCVCVI